MSRFVRGLFRSRESNARPQTGPLPPGVEFSPVSESKPLREEEITALANRLRDHLSSRSSAAEARNGRAPRESEGDVTVSRLLDVLQDMRAQEDESRVNPFRSDPGTSGNQRHATSKKGKEARQTKSRYNREDQACAMDRSGRGQLEEAIEACRDCIDVVKRFLRASRGMQTVQGDELNRLLLLLQAQLEELQTIRQYLKEIHLPSLEYQATLHRIYLKVHKPLLRLKSASPRETSETVLSLIMVLVEGPDYLIDVAIIDGMIWYAEVIDSGFGAKLRRALGKALSEQTSLALFRQEVGGIVSQARRIPRDAVDDGDSKAAAKAITRLSDLLDLRIASTRAVEPVSSDISTMHPSRSAPPAAPPISPASSRSSSPEPSPEFQSLDGRQLEEMFGTGPIAPTKPPPLPFSSGPQRPARKHSEASVESVEPEIWEYRGTQLTRSALELVLRQERLAFADSSGQYAGEVSWDDVRNAWIPKWAEKLKPEELAEGEVPDMNPAGFTVRKTDAWGNKIGWQDGIMYYEEEPNFDLRE